MVSIEERDIKYNIFLLKCKYKKTIFLILLLITSIKTNKIGITEAWVQKKHKGLLIASYEARSFLGTNSLLQYDKNIQYTQGVVNLYGEYGITNRITLTTKIIAIDSMLMNKNRFLGKVQERSIGLDTAQFITRIGIIRKYKTIALSIIAGIGTPSVYRKNQASQFAIRRYKQISGIEIGINVSKYDFFIFTASYYWNIQHWYNEIHFEVIYGHYFLKSLLFMVRFQEFIYQIHNDIQTKNSYNRDNNEIFNFIANSGFAKITFSLATPIMQNLMLEFGFYSSIKSKLLKTQDLGLKMYGCFISLWYNF